MPKEIIDHPSIVKVKLLPVSVDALELSKASDNIWLNVDRSITRWANEAGDRGADALDTSVAERTLFNIYAGCDVFGHGLSPFESDRVSIHN